MTRRHRMGVTMLALWIATSACRPEDPETAGAKPGPQEPGVGAAGTDSASDGLWARTFGQLSAEIDASSVVVGDSGWLFFAPELRHLSLGPFWGEQAAAVSRASDPQNADPVAAIVDLHRQLEERGIRLLFVPVPAKAAIYTEHLPGDPPAAVTPTQRADPQDRALLAELANAGVDVLDLAPAFLAGKADGEALFCLTDTHWSPRGIAIAAEAIVAHLGDRSWSRDAPISDLEVRTGTLVIEGDLWQRLPAPRPAKETLGVTFIGPRPGTEAKPFPLDRQSPVLLLGDSHALVFHAGTDMHTEDAGLPEHLAWRLGFGVDVVAVRGSGATPARINLLRRAQGLAGKRVVVWVISVREYTEGQGWAKIPIPGSS